MTPIQRFKLLDTILWIHTSAGLSASAAHLFLLHHYHGQPERDTVFKTNVANSIVHRSIEALINQSVVGTYETLSKEIQRFGSLGFEITGLSELKGHRNYTSHPGTVEWRKDMKEFIERELHYRDIKAVRLYQARQAVIDKLHALGHNEKVSDNGALATNGIAEMIILCLKKPSLLASEFRAI